MEGSELPVWGPSLPVVDSDSSSRQGPQAAVLEGPSQTDERQSPEGEGAAWSTQRPERREPGPTASPVCSQLPPELVPLGQPPPFTSPFKQPTGLDVSHCLVVLTAPLQPGWASIIPILQRRLREG